MKLINYLQYFLEKEDHLFGIKLPSGQHIKFGEYSSPKPMISSPVQVPTPQIPNQSFTLSSMVPAVAAPLAAGVLTAGGTLLAKHVVRRMNPELHQQDLKTKYSLEASRGNLEKAQRVNNKLNKHIAKHGDRLKASEVIEPRSDVPAISQPESQSVVQPAEYGIQSGITS